MSELYYEAAVSLRLGLSRADLKSMRDEILGEHHWSLVDRQIVLTRIGLDRILNGFRDRGIGINSEEFADCRVPESSNGKRPDLETLTVLRLLKNPRIIEALNAAGERVMVQIKVSRNFRPQMTLNATKNEAGHYIMVGRCPRFPGRY